MDGPREGPSETDGVDLARTRAPSETDEALSGKTPSKENTKSGLLERGHLREMAGSHINGPHVGSSEADGARLARTSEKASPGKL